MGPPSSTTSAAYDPSGVHRSEVVYATVFSSLFQLHEANQWVHSISSLPHALEFVVFLFGYAFNPVSIPMWISVMTMVGTTISPQIIDSTNASQSTTATGQQQVASFLFPGVFYFCTVLVTLLATEACKASVKATRPEALLSADFCASKLRRYGPWVASLKSKHSFPSGDSAQAANLVWFVSRYMLSGESWNTTNAGAFFFAGVAFARVFYHCHWIEDTLGGALLASALHQWVIPMVASQLQQVVPQVLLKLL